MKLTPVATCVMRGRVAPAILLISTSLLGLGCSTEGLENLDSFGNPALGEANSTDTAGLPAVDLLTNSIVTAGSGNDTDLVLTVPTSGAIVHGQTNGSSGESESVGSTTIALPAGESTLAQATSESSPFAIEPSSGSQLESVTEPQEELLAEKAVENEVSGSTTSDSLELGAALPDTDVTDSVAASSSESAAGVVTISWSAAQDDDLGYYVYYQSSDEDYRLATQVSVSELDDGSREIQFDLPDDASVQEGLACFTVSAWSTFGETARSEEACASV